MSFFSRKRYSLSEDVFNKHVKFYDTIKPSQSYRGIAVIVYLLLLGIGTLLTMTQTGFSLKELSYSFIGLCIFAPALYFTYYGKRWAIILFMTLLILNQIILLVLEGSVAGIIITIALLSFLQQALKIENARKKIPHSTP